MVNIFNNTQEHLLPRLRESIAGSYQAKFCLAYFNLRGWQQIGDLIEKFHGGENNCCQLLIGIPNIPEDEVCSAYSPPAIENYIDNRRANNLKKHILSNFRQQLTIGIPTNEDEASLRLLSNQLKTKKVIVKLFLPYPIYVNFYLIYSYCINNSVFAFFGANNITLSGITKKLEASLEVLENDICYGLQKLFDSHWNDNWCIDISKELVEIIDESWAGERQITPYHIYLKIAYHLSSEAINSLSEFPIPREFENILFAFQKAAVQIAAQKINKRGGVLIGDVVGLGKTLVATVLTRIFEEKYGISTLIICPTNLEKMWQMYIDKYGMRAKILPLSQVKKEKLQNIPARFKMVLIDESHNLRNRKGKRYKAIREYIKETESKCILLSATPYNKTYLDLSSQLGLFIPEDKNLFIRPESLISEIGEIEFFKLHQCSITSLSTFEKSNYPEDWRDLMRLFMVRRTRKFIKDNYATQDELNRAYLKLPDGNRFYFPKRLPKTIKFKVGTPDNDPYALLYSEKVIQVISDLNLPRYGLGNYILYIHQHIPTTEEKDIIDGLSRAGKQVLGFCRINLFKRLESCAYSFILSIERHILRNYIYLYAIENGLDIPIGTQDIALLITEINDEDKDITLTNLDENLLKLNSNYTHQAGVIYQKYANEYKHKFKWLRPTLFSKKLKDDLLDDAEALNNILNEYNNLSTKKDEKLEALIKLLQIDHPLEKVLIFSQFADTVDYLHKKLKNRNITQVEKVTGKSNDPTGTAWRFSPISNEKAQHEFSINEELRILIATDVLSEGQNLQDSAIIVNYDLPWAIIRLIQRAGRVDRIGQQSPEILCYSFLPADGVEQIINLRGRLHQRLRENAEVIGTDEIFFEDEKNQQVILDDLYNEKSGTLDGDEDTEVDLISEAYEIWKNATDGNPSLKKTIKNLPSVVYSTRSVPSLSSEGIILLFKVAEDNLSLIWIDQSGNVVTQSPTKILRYAACDPNTPPSQADERHHQLVRRSVEIIIEEGKNVGGQLGGKKGARFRTYEQLKQYFLETAGTEIDSQEIQKVIEEIYRFPLQQSANKTLNQRLNLKISSKDLANLVLKLHREDSLCEFDNKFEQQEPQLMCSLGLFSAKEN